MELIFLLIYLFLGWNPLLCSSQTAYWVFFAMFAYHGLVLGLLGYLFDQCKLSYGLIATWLSLFFWSLLGDHARAFFHLGVNTYLLISCLLILVCIVTYLIVRVDNYADGLIEQNRVMYMLAQKDVDKRMQELQDKTDRKLNIITCQLNCKFNDLKGRIQDNDPILIMKRNERIYRLLMKPLEEIPFFIDNPRILNVLRDQEVLSMFHLCQIDSQSMGKMHGIGKTTVKKINDYLINRGLCLGYDVFSVVKRHDLYAFYCK